MSGEFPEPKKNKAKQKEKNERKKRRRKGKHDDKSTLLEKGYRKGWEGKRE